MAEAFSGTVATLGTGRRRSQVERAVACAPSLKARKNPFEGIHRGL